MLEQTSTDVEVQRAIVNSAGEIGGTAGAKVLLKILEQNPNPTDVKVQRAIAYSAGSIGKIGGGIEMLLKILEQNPADVGVQRTIAYWAERNWRNSRKSNIVKDVGANFY